MPAIRALVVASSSVLVVAAAHGESKERPLVVILGDPADPVTRRLDAELRVAGFDIRVSPTIADDAPEGMGEAARREGAVASIRVRPSKAGVEIWIFDRITGKAVLREVALPPGGDPELVTTRAVELLRASLLEVNETHASRGDVEPPATVIQWTQPPIEPRLRALAGVGAHGSFASFGMSPSLFAALQWWPTQRLGIGVNAIVPFAATRLRDEEGSTRLSATTAAIDVRTSFRVGSIRVRPGAGVAITWLSATGDAAAGYRAATDRITSGSGFGALDARIPLARRLAIVGGAWVGVSLREVPVRFAGREVARWGRPWFAAAFSLELEWP